MAFDPKEYEKKMKELAELKADDGFKKYIEAKNKEKEKFVKEAEQLYTALQKKNFSNSDIAVLAGKVKWLATKADEKKE